MEAEEGGEAGGFHDQPDCNGELKVGEYDPGRYVEIESEKKSGKARGSENSKLAQPKSSTDEGPHSLQNGRETVARRRVTRAFMLFPNHHKCGSQQDREIAGERRTSNILIGQIQLEQAELA